MWVAIVGIVSGLIAWYNATFSPEARLKRAEVRAAVREGEAKLRAEQLKRAYDKIDAEKKKSDADLLDSLNRK